MKKQADGVLLTMEHGTLRIEVCSDSIVRVTYAAGDSIPDTPQYAIIKNSWAESHWWLVPDDKTVKVSTPLISVTIAKKDGAILYADATGKKLFQDYDRSLTPVEVNGEKAYRSELFSNLWDSTEGFFGLGQHQAGVWNYRGESCRSPGQHEYFCANFSVEQGLRNLLEQRFAQPHQQSISARALSEFGSRGHHGLLFFLRARVRQDHRGVSRD